MQNSAQRTHWYDTVLGKHDATIAFKVAGLSETEKVPAKQGLLTNEQIARTFDSANALVDFLAGFVNGISTPNRRFAVSVALKMLSGPSNRDSS